MSKIIIGFTGCMVAGKGTASEYVKEKYGATIYGFSGPLRDVLKRLNVPLERANLAKLSSVLRDGFGQDVMSKTIANDVSQDANQIIVLDGIRRLEDVATFRSIPGFILVSVEAEQKLRYERLTMRRQNVDDSTKTFEDFCKDEGAEADAQVPLIMKEAEVIINNNGNLEQLHEQLDELLKKLQNN